MILSIRESSSQLAVGVGVLQIFDHQLQKQSSQDVCPKLDIILPSIKMDNPTDTQSEATSYIETQFFFYMLTCYYAIIAFSIRYNKIMKDPPEINFLITCLENQPEYVPDLSQAPAPASYAIKSKFCVLNSYLYLFMALFSLVGTEDVFYACKHRKFGVIYMFGFAAWTMAAVVLRREYQRKINQSLWTHRIFWIFSGTFAITKMFEDYLLPMNFVLNCVSIASNFVLAVYGIYRPEDNDTITLIDNEDIPGVVKLFFQYIQLNQIVRKILRIQDPPSMALQQNIDVENLGQIDLNTLEQAFKITTESRREEINLLNELPRRNIFIDKKLQYIKNPNGTVKICYFIFTQIGNQRFQASRTYKEFIKLEEDLSFIFNEKNFPKLILPRIKKSETSELTNQSETLQEWLAEVVKKPLFIAKPLLAFLNINEQSSAPFLTYFEVSYKSFCSNAFMVSQLRKKEAKTNRVSLVGYYDEEAQTSTPNSSRLNSMIKEKLEFIVEVDDEITEQKEYGFIFTCLRQQKSKEKIRWKLQKYEENILQLNYRIEEECKISIPFYYTMISNLSKKNHKLKSIAFCDYIQKLLNDEKYYCVSLFQFARFDPITVQPKIIGIDAALSKRDEKVNPRLSHYFQEYDDHQDNTVSVLRVDRTSGENEPNQFKFQIRRKHFTLFRTSSQITGLRKQLAEVYQGVCFVPIIGYEECNKSQAKERTQKFLTSLQNLPKIAICQSFAKFYHHTL